MKKSTWKNLRSILVIAGIGAGILWIIKARNRRIPAPNTRTGGDATIPSGNSYNVLPNSTPVNSATGV